MRPSRADAYPSVQAFRIKVSADGKTGRPSGPPPEDGGPDTARFTAVPARFVRVMGPERGTGWGYSLHQDGVFSR